MNKRAPWESVYHLPEAPSPPYRGPNPDRSGPDGKGIDPRIQSSEDLQVFLREVVGHLSSLKILVWGSPCMSMPPSVFQALMQTTNLKRLGLILQVGRAAQYTPLHR